MIGLVSLFLLLDEEASHLERQSGVEGRGASVLGLIEPYLGPELQWSRRHVVTGDVDAWMLIFRAIWTGH